MTKFNDFLKKIEVNPEKLTPEANDVLYLGFIKLHEINGVDPNE